MKKIKRSDLNLPFAITTGMSFIGTVVAIISLLSGSGVRIGIWAGFVAFLGILGTILWFASFFVKNEGPDQTITESSTAKQTQTTTKTTNSDTETAPPKKRWMVGISIIVIVVIAIAVIPHILPLFTHNNNDNPIAEEPPTAEPALTDTTPTNSVAATTPTSTTATTTATTTVTATSTDSVGTDPYLAELKVLQDALDVYYNKTYEVSGQPYVHSILADCDSNCTTQKKISYNLGKKYRKLTFGVGIEDNSATREQVAVFTLIADGKPIFEKTTQKNEPVTSQEVDVTDVLTLELAVTATKNKNSQLVWMTPQLHS